MTSIAARLALLSGLLFSAHSAAFGADPDHSRVLVAQGGITIGQAVPCGRSYREVARGMSCQGLFDFQKSCRGELNALTVATALRLRCPEELLEQKYKGMQEGFARLEQQKSCAAATSFVEQYTTDFELADAPEFEKANVLRIKLCEQQIRDKELAALESGLRDVLARNDCAGLRAFEKQNTLKFSPDQSSRIAAATKQRCDFENQATATLRSCLSTAETAGNFCGGAVCFRAFKEALPQDAYFAPQRAESQRHDNICREFISMRSCFSSDECGGERCSLPARLAVGSGPLMSQIERNERDAKQTCTAKLERERLARLEAEREAQRRQEELRKSIRRDNTFRLSICNRSAQSKIWVALSYYDYDENSWIREGWWSINRGSCDYIGDRFRRGKLYFYAHGPGEKWVWKGTMGMCTDTARFRRQSTAGYTCDKSRYKLFRERDVSDDTFELPFT